MNRFSKFQRHMIIMDGMHMPKILVLKIYFRFALENSKMAVEMGKMGIPFRIERVITSNIISVDLTICIINMQYGSVGLFGLLRLFG